MKQVYHALLALIIQCFPISAFCQNAHDKWIVVTTINYPSKALKKLATLPGWRLVVIGDRKTPNDWYLENCDFLSIERQQALDYEIIKFLPENHYCRKNIGYLYAISQGAQIIYETDDDNELIENYIFIPDAHELVELNAIKTHSVNVFAYFGQPSVWPRGFPLDHIAHGSNYQIKNECHERWGIIQGLVNKDPDVDAIFRLTQYKDVYFDQKAPCIIPAKVFCPFNTQNTLFSYEAFWGLLIPTTTSFRVCDIWRSYIVQRLLWDLDLRLCFTSPTAIQERNQHNLFKDFCDEQDLYLKAGNLIQCLLDWEGEVLEFKERIKNVTHKLVEAQYLQKEELAVLQAWINDLTKLGYQFPSLK